MLSKIPDCPECGSNSAVCEKDFHQTRWKNFSEPYQIWKCSRCKKEYEVHFVLKL
jgi:transposase-like protein